jgi:hypothetical protein
LQQHNLFFRCSLLRHDVFFGRRVVHAFQLPPSPVGLRRDKQSAPAAIMMGRRG